MSDDTSREANLRAIQRMLAYAMVESRREGLPEVVELLGTAQLILGSALSRGSARPVPSAEPADPPEIRLVASRDAHYAEGGETDI